MSSLLLAELLVGTDDAVRTKTSTTSKSPQNNAEVVGVGKEMPISRIVVSVPNSNAVLLD
jgi:hypothetical protein